jgi:signal transduction histidine kinase
MQRAFSFLADRRWAGVGLALVVEAVSLVSLSLASPSEVVGVPAAVAASVGGTVTVVFGLWEGVGVAFCGALVFAAAGGWETGELVSVAVWPAIVGAAGVFAGRVSVQRKMIRSVLAGHERERQQLALALHDDTAQGLVAALMSLEYAERVADPEQVAAASRDVRSVLRDTIRNVRAISVGLRPRALDDFGLARAVERLCTDFGERTAISVELDDDLGPARVSLEAELALYRAIQEALANVAAHAEATAVQVTLRRTRDGAAAVVHDDGRGFDPAETGNGFGLEELRDRTRLLGGRVAIRSTAGAGTTLTVEIPTA